jgi:hypothetical protein
MRSRTTYRVGQALLRNGVEESWFPRSRQVFEGPTAHLAPRKSFNRVLSSLAADRYSKQCDGDTRNLSIVNALLESERRWRRCVVG